MMILENYPITFVCNLLVYSKIKYSTIVIIVSLIVYDNKSHRTISQYIMGYIVLRSST